MRGEAACAQDSLELIATVYLVVKKALLATYRLHPTLTYPVFDRPTIKVLGDLTEIYERQVAWAEQITAQLARDAIQGGARGKPTWSGARRGRRPRWQRNGRGPTPGAT